MPLGFGGISKGGISDPSGPSGSTINAALGVETSAGLGANVILTDNIAAGLGTEASTGLSAGVVTQTTVSGTVGIETGAGLGASVSSGNNITGSVGVETSAGLGAGVVNPNNTSGSLGTEASTGLSATVVTGTPTNVNASLAAELSAGLGATVATPFPLAPSARNTYTGYANGYGNNFRPKRVAETEVFTCDFGLLLSPGETIVSATWTVSVWNGIDNNAMSMIVGASNIVGGTKSCQLIGLGQSNVIYAPICTAVTTLGQVLILPDEGQGLLQVLP